MKKGKLSQSEKNIIHKMYNNNKTVKDISVFLDRSENSILIELGENIIKEEVVSEGSKILAKKSTWVDDGTIATQKQFQQTKEEKQSWQRRTPRPKIKLIKAKCRTCAKYDIVDPALVMHGEFSCDKCLRKYA